MAGFSVNRIAQSFIRPAEPTPAVSESLSCIDRVPGLRHTVRSLHVFEHGKEPASVIRDALSKVLVWYYPFAGRFVGSIPDGDVHVACTGEGVCWFVEAKAGYTLGDVNKLDHPLVISEDELLPQPGLDMDPLSMPVMMQVTEFTCGGFVIGLIEVHTLADGIGAAQFLNAIADLAQGLPEPTVKPVWCRELIPNPPKLPPGPPPVFPSFNLQQHVSDVDSTDVAYVKAQYMDSTGHFCSTFDVCIAKAWQARTRSIGLSPETLVHVCFFASTRHLLKSLPDGFYGNCFYPVTATATSGAVTSAKLIEVVKMIRDAKGKLSGDFTRWAVGDFEKDPYQLTFEYNSLFVSDWTRLGFLEVDYGWGTPSHVVPFQYVHFMAVAILAPPPTPKKGTRIMTQCVEKEHLLAFRDEMKSFF